MIARTMRSIKMKVSLVSTTAISLLLAVYSAHGATDAELYENACSACHGSDGVGRSQQDVAFETPLPDFSDCEFASREPDPDWFAVIHEGGPVRAFDRMMPAFGDALEEDEINQILSHVRTFCTDDRWPRGEFNLPRPLFTEKAFPEDETVVTTSYDTGDNKAYAIEFLYEKRFGPVGMVEIAVPLVSFDPLAGGRNTGIGDISIGYKRALFHDLHTGNIFTAGVEVILPTGDDSNGLGSGTTVLEPFVAYAKILPADAFFQAHALAEFPTKSGFNDQIGLRLAIGKTWTTGGPFGRAWSPMLEVLATRVLGGGGITRVDAVPQFQVSLNTRQHILLNVGTRIPVSETRGRDPEILMYLIWDWFDGGFFDGW